MSQAEGLGTLHVAFAKQADVGNWAELKAQGAGHHFPAQGMCDACIIDRPQGSSYNISLSSVSTHWALSAVLLPGSFTIMAKNITFKDHEPRHLENVENEKGFTTPSSSSLTEVPFTIDPKVSARLRHAIDWRLIPALGAMYGISLMDRKNVSNAAIAGMLVDLNMRRGMGYNLVNLCFFITYVLCQPFMVILCRKVGPRYFLPGMYHVPRDEREIC